jgi:4-hydroxybenzoate polyprenyltransferase
MGGLFCMAPCIVKEGIRPGDALIPREGARVKSGSERFGLHLRNMRLIGGDTVITAALLPLLGFFLLHGLQDVPWLTIAGLLLVGLLLTATSFGLNNVTDVKIDARDPLKQTNGINPIALGQLTQREAMIPLLGCGLLALAVAAWLSVLPWALLALTIGALYSVPPVRLKERAGLDLLAHSLLPLSILLMGMAVAHANHPLRAAVGAAWVCLISAKSDTTHLIRDYESDREHNIGTTAVRLGIRAVWWLRLGLVLAAAGLLLFANWWGAFSLIPSLLLAVIMVLETLTIFRPSCCLLKQRLLLRLSYTAGGGLFVLLSG